MADYSVTYDQLDTLLQELDPNTADTPYEIEITVVTIDFLLGGGDNPFPGTLRYVLCQNLSKFVSINWGEDAIRVIENINDSMWNFVMGASNLVSIDMSHFISLTGINQPFPRCTALKNLDLSNLTQLSYISHLAGECTSLESVNLSGLTNLKVIAFSFIRCSNLKYVNLTGCNNIESSPLLFYGCSALKSIILPNMIKNRDVRGMFSGCTSLEEIHNWTVPVEADYGYVSYSEDLRCFAECTSLLAIYTSPSDTPPQEDTWRTWDIKKDTANSRSEVMIYGTSGNSVAVQVPSSGAYTLEVSAKVDELLFSADSAITSTHIQKMLQTKAPITGNVNTLDPTKDNFLMLAKDRTAAKTNITTDVVEAGNLLPPTSAAVYAAIDANKSGGIPLGGWTSFENDTAPNDDWIQAGTTFDSDTYPELFLYLGGNTVPKWNEGEGERTTFGYPYNSSEQSYTLNNFSSYKTMVLNNASPYNTSPNPTGTWFISDNGSSYIDLEHYRQWLVDNNYTGYPQYGSSGSGRDAIGMSNVSWDKVTDVFTFTLKTRAVVSFIKKPKIRFIKATTTASSYTPSTAVQEIKDYTKDYVDASNSYSTEETLTGGTWIDGKPIYRRTFHFNTMLIAGTPIYTVNVGQANFDTWIKTYYIGRRSNMTDIMTAYFPTWTVNNYTGLKISVSSDEVMFVDYMVLEYTKKTTP